MRHHERVLYHWEYGHYPRLETGTILEGVTRDSTIICLKKWDLRWKKEPLSIDEIIDAYKAAVLYEVFGTGTAATISLIKELKYKDYVMKFDVEKWSTAPEIKSRMNAIRYGQEPDIMAGCIRFSI